MNKTAFMISCSFIVLILTLSCATGEKETDNSNCHNMAEGKSGDSLSDVRFSNYNDVLKLQKKIMKDFTWPLKHELDLNGDGIKEEFMAVEGYSRGMSYVLFRRKNQVWELISGSETIPSGHLGIIKLKNKKKGWHDFTALQPSGRDGIVESHFIWDGKQYILKNQKEVQPGN